LNLALICVGAGTGQRFGGDKLAERLGERTVLETSVAALARAFPAAPQYVVVPANRLGAWRRRLLATLSPFELLEGGPRRQDSVRVGVERAVECGADVVVVHDAARPLVDPQDVKGVVLALGEADGAVLVARVADTVKRVDNEGLVLETVPRQELRLALTPQVFKVPALYRAWEEGDFHLEWTDEAAILESLGGRVRSVVARSRNPKLTTQSDLELMRSLLGVGP
jgi:2-C-methyl-D-erythritol 4-phosphate cytidylyltransferase/2-C-methyl-D-erythritol 2,4-cyclodiphosphate synthase